MARKRPCGVCSKWFYPDPRQGEQQHTCGRSDCRKEWHRRACAKWHEQNPDYDAHTRLVRRLVKDESTEQRARRPDPLALIDWPLARDEVGLKFAVLVEETGKVLIQRTRDLIPA